MEQSEQEVVTPLPKPAALEDVDPAAPAAAGTTGTSVFHTDGISIYYGSFRAVTDVSLTVYENEITAFIGPSGCGKTTVLRTLNRMNDLVAGARVEGDVHYRGASLYAKDVSPTAVRRRIGMVFQKPNPFPKSIYDNIAWAPRNLGMKENLDERVEKALRGAAIWDEVKDRLNRSALGLSGGQQQRLCIARAIAIEPEVLLLDEPASALDPIATALIEDLMQELKSAYTLLIVTHNMQQAARVAERTAFFSLSVEGGKRTGVLVEYDDTQTIFTRPADKRTQDYVTGRFG
jgi:phosphate transport system ATP-binding protein